MASYSAVGEQAVRFPDLLPLTLETEGLDDRDAALAHTIYDTTVRRWLTLSRVLLCVGGRAIPEMEPPVQSALLCGAAQLLLLDRVPDHAVLDESVEWVKIAGRPQAAGMVNAILRKVIASRGDRRPEWTNRCDEIPRNDGTAVGFNRDVLTEEPYKRLSEATSLPPKTLVRWAEQFGEERTFEYAVHSLFKAPAVVHIAHATSDLDEGKDLLPHRSSAHRVFAGADGTLRSLLSRRRDVWVQDEASSAPIGMVADLKPARVLDLCAGQGTKTRQLAGVFPEAEILATDVDTKRLETLRATFSGHEKVRVLGYPEGVSDGQGWGDLVLLDVPCSNSGVLPRRLEARYRPAKAQLKRLTAIQRQILEKAVGLLSPGGRILYATCSLEREENEDMAGWAVETLGLKIEKQHRTWPGGIPGEGAQTYCDGSYGVVLTRDGALA